MVEVMRPLQAVVSLCRAGESVQDIRLGDVLERGVPKGSRWAPMTEDATTVLLQVVRKPEHRTLDP